MKRVVDAAKQETCDQMDEISIDGLTLDEIAEVLPRSDEANQRNIIHQLDFEKIITGEGLTDAVLRIISVAVQYIGGKIDEMLTDEMISHIFSRFDEEYVKDTVCSLCRIDQRFIAYVSENIESIDIDEVGIIFAYSREFFDERMGSIFDYILSIQSDIATSAVLNAAACILLCGDREQKSLIIKSIKESLPRLLQADNIEVIKGLLECVNQIDKSNFTVEFGEEIFKLMVAHEDLIVICSVIIADAGLEWKDVGTKAEIFFLENISLIDAPYQVRKAAFKIFATFFNNSVPREYYPSVLDMLFTLFEDTEIGENAIKLATLILMADNECVSCFEPMIDELGDIANSQSAHVAAMFLIEQIEQIKG
jgi:hypothetical protein